MEVFDLQREDKEDPDDSRSRTRCFNVGDRVLLFNSRLKIFSGMLKTHWIGPSPLPKYLLMVLTVITKPSGPNLKVNGHCDLNTTWEGQYQPMIVPDYEASRACGFVLRSLELQSFA
ncbi:hypothetical protein Tco_1378646 [Tanacetum coccineum]